MATQYDQPLIVIVGPTASGKTALALEIAKRYGGEIVCADSRTVYKDLNIGTAKPTKEEQAQVPHHLLDVTSPNDVFTVADFQRLATSAIADIRARGKLPLLVGGSGLYVDALLFDYELGATPDRDLRVRLEQMTVEELQEYCKNNNISKPENSKNKRYLVRAIEQKGVNNRSRAKTIPNVIVVGISTNKDILRQRIHDRIINMFHLGVVKEATNAAAKYGWGSSAMTGNCYPLIHNLQKGEITEVQTRQKMEVLDWRLAKRQLTWLRRNPYINWLTAAQAGNFLKSYLSTVKTCYYRTR